MNERQFSNPGCASSTVFIVDDDAAVRSALSMLVHSCGWKPRPCASAEEFLECYTRQGRGCLVLDLQMPGMTGADLMDILADLDLQLPVIVITAHADHAMADRARASGALAVIGKPFRDDELLGWIETALTRSAPAGEAD
ncbi:response regulator [Hydrogenophaga sp.]|uniref:response regulator transcription factor n=1 Tax=Hydrogenophaga sp. TaxID=1904254 RepID=UPI00262E0279|nr:response regulator [Hydrogenophaga sp.]MCW5655949.1 response regulator [Hydrogenophaga sp.]